MLVQRIRDAGPDTGLYGARITGGGSGGTVAILARADAGPTIQRIARNYAEYTAKPSRVFTGSSHGAMQTPVQILR
jgi:L-arabinokinase